MTEDDPTRGLPEGPGELRRLIRGFDWARTALGAIDGWPRTLLTATRIVLGSPVPMVILWGRAGTMIYNDAYSTFAGSRHPQLLGVPVLEGWPEVAEFNRRVMEVCLAGGTLSFHDQYLVLHRRGVPEDVWLDLNYSPIPDEEGLPGGVLAIVVETTERILAEQALRRNEERLRLATAAAGSIGTWDWHVVTDELFGDARFAEMLGVAPELAARGAAREVFLAGVHPADLKRVDAAMQRAIETRTHYSAEYRLRKPSETTGAARWVMSSGECQYDDDGRPGRFTGVLVDISARKHAEEERQLLVRELNHRMKNLFAVASGMVATTATTASSPRAMADALLARLNALSRAHDLIQPAVVGSLDSASHVPLGNLIDSILAPFAEATADGVECVRKEGPTIPIGPHCATTLALTLHELATNAAKYGALSSPAGRVAIRWRSEGRHLRLEWHEEGGPEVAGPPTRSGVGTRIAQMSVVGQLGGRLGYDWAGSGVRISMTMLLERLRR